jgi:hypothetical protein
MGSNNSHHHNDEIKETKEKNSTIKEVLPKIIGESIFLNETFIKKLLKKLPSEKQKIEEWFVLYSSKKDGLSIQTFNDTLSNKGPNILIIQSTKSNHLFGSYNSHSWNQLNGSFFGNSTCFLFTYINEELITYESGGYNDNYQYFSYGFKYDKFNGLGIGGQIGYHSVTIIFFLNIIDLFE